MLHLKYSHMQGAFQLFIQAFDDDPGINIVDVLDNIFIDLTLSRNAGFTDTSAYTGISNRVTVNMHFQLRCDDNFYGSDCVTFCLAMDDDTNGHYTCNDDGSFQCRTGFENPGNNCRDRESIRIKYFLNLTPIHYLQE